MYEFQINPCTCIGSEMWLMSMWANDDENYRSHKTSIAINIFTTEQIGSNCGAKETINVEKITRNMSKWMKQPSYGNNECSFSNRMATSISCQILFSRNVGSCGDFVNYHFFLVNCMQRWLPFDGFFMQTSTCESHFDRTISFSTQLHSTNTHVLRWK